MNTPSKAISESLPRNILACLVYAGYMDTYCFCVHVRGLMPIVEGKYKYYFDCVAGADTEIKKASELSSL